jgi:hypothetical protein
MSTEDAIVEQITQSARFRSWRHKYGDGGKADSESVGVAYQYIGPTFTNSFAEEKHWTPIEVAKQWGVSPDLIRSLFRNEPGVLMFDRPGARAKRSYATLRIPDSVLTRVHTRLSSKASVLK